MSGGQNLWGAGLFAYAVDVTLPTLMSVSSGLTPGSKWLLFLKLVCSDWSLLAKKTLDFRWEFVGLLQGFLPVGPTVEFSRLSCSSFQNPLTHSSNADLKVFRTSVTWF